MEKSNYLFIILNLYPCLINSLMMLIFATSSKNNKYNPITYLLLLILLTLLITMKMNLLINSWGSFTLFLIMIGGLMIIFMYITSLANNELFMLNYKIIMINFMKISPLIMIFMLMNFNFIDWNNTNTWFNFMFENYNLNFYQNYIKPYSMNTIFIMNYLFYSMICIMNICYKFKSPLRQLFF